MNTILQEFKIKKVPERRNTFVLMESRRGHYFDNFFQRVH
jgi:hypothetical protein